MEIDDLKQVWKQQKRSPDLEYSQSELLMLVNNKMISFEKDIRTRDRRELIACAIVAAASIFYFFSSPSIWMKSGSVFIVLSCMLIGYRLIKAQPSESRDEPSYNHSISHHLQSELENVRNQKRMLTNVAWWYIGPICTGIILFSIGFAIPLVYKLIYIVVVVAMGIGIWYLNQKAVTDLLDPLITDIQESLEFLESQHK